LIISGIISAHYDCPIDFPYGVLLVSGGHTLITIAEKLGKYETLGISIDDAAGECFDKIAREIGLSQPGGPAIEKLAQKGNNCVDLPVPLMGDKSCNFSFSGLKTAAIRAFKMGQKAENIAASLQEKIACTLCERLQNALQKKPEIKTWALVGGVAANKYIYQRLKITAEKFNSSLFSPSIHMCTDNAAMIAYCGWLYAQKGMYSDFQLDVSAQKGLRASFLILD
jgi:N6-L-threonylcarbamoyladenine synthase